MSMPQAPLAINYPGNATFIDHMKPTGLVTHDSIADWIGLQHPQYRPFPSNATFFIVQFGETNRFDLDWTAKGFGVTTDLYKARWCAYAMNWPTVGYYIDPENLEKLLNLLQGKYNLFGRGTLTDFKIHGMSEHLRDELSNRKMYFDVYATMGTIVAPPSTHGDPKRLSEHSNLFVIFYTDVTPEADGSFNIGVAYTTDRTIAQDLKTCLTDLGFPNAVHEFALYETHNGRQRFDIETFVNWARQIDTDWAQLLGESLMSLDQTTQKFIAESRNMDNARKLLERKNIKFSSERPINWAATAKKFTATYSD